MLIVLRNKKKKTYLLKKLTKLKKDSSNNTQPQMFKDDDIKKLEDMVNHYPVKDLTENQTDFLDVIKTLNTAELSDQDRVVLATICTNYLVKQLKKNNSIEESSDAHKTLKTIADILGKRKDIYLDRSSRNNLVNIKATVFRTKSLETHIKNQKVRIGNIDEVINLYDELCTKAMKDEASNTGGNTETDTNTD